MLDIHYKSGPSGKESVVTRDEKKEEQMQLVCPLFVSSIPADDSVPRRRRRVAEITSSTIDVEVASTEDERNLAAS